MAFEIPLTKGKVSIVDDMDAHLNSYNWLFNGGYAIKKVRLSNGKQLNASLHHAIIGRPLGNYQVDHINGNKLDNRRENLRFVSIRENGLNKICHREGTSSSKYPGVYLRKCKYKNKIYPYWVARTTVNKKRVHIGYFDTEELAMKAYKYFYKTSEEKNGS